MFSFISFLSVDIVTCFEEKPRRRRNEDLNSDIDRNIILISEWYFKSKSTNDTDAYSARTLQHTKQLTRTSEGSSLIHHVDDMEIDPIDLRSTTSNGNNISNAENGNTDSDRTVLKFCLCLLVLNDNDCWWLIIILVVCPTVQSVR